MQWVSDSHSTQVSVCGVRSIMRYALFRNCHINADGGLDGSQPYACRWLNVPDSVF